MAQGKTCVEPFVVNELSMSLRLNILRDTDTCSDVLR
jgi:hypothetical protein